MIIHSTQLKKPIAFPFVAPQDLTTERILSEFQRVIQSNREFRLNDTVDVNVIHVSLPSGGKGGKRTSLNLEKHLEKKRSVIRIQNNDELCMARALVVAKAKLDTNPQYKSIVDHRRPMQTRLAQELHTNAGVPSGPCGIEEAKKFQMYLAEYQINIVSKEYDNKIIYAGPDKDQKIYLYLHNNHYDVITKMPGFFARSYYCHTCKKAYHHYENHVCPDACKCCGFRPACPEGSSLECNDCHRSFKSQQCYNRHKERRGEVRSVCESLFKCKDCKKVVRRCYAAPEKHQCGVKRCSICGENVQTEGHRCFIQPETKKKKDRFEEEDDFLDGECREDDEEILTDLLFFDFECRQENGTHEPNLCIVQNEAGDEWIFKGDTTQKDFCEWLFTPEHAGCTVMAHNFQGYDSYFILQYLREQGVRYDVIMRGAKTLSLKVPMFKIQFIDSLNFIPMKLANFPKTFGMEELAKGDFPHLFNTEEHENYIGPIPPTPYYSPNGMSPKDREAFLTWHQDMRDRNYIFNFQEEIVRYCRSDVCILRRCCMEFRELFHEITDIDPFTTLTIAAACHKVYRTNYLPKDTIAVIPPMGYAPETKQSLIAHKWLSCLSEKNDVYI